jgi:branched-chain amino acid transport system ATP-binding protein
MILEIENINVHYGAIHAVKDVTFNLAEGEIVSLIGANGAGKSTNLNTFSGILHPTSGKITCFGEEITHAAPQAIVRKGVVQVPEGRKIFASMSVWENLEMGAYIHNNRPEINARMESIFSRFPRLKRAPQSTRRTLSGGEQQMLAIARGLMANRGSCCWTNPPWDWLRWW